MSVGGILQDYSANRGYAKSQLIMILFRLASLSKSNASSPLRQPIRLLAAVVYKLVSEWVLGVEIPISTNIGKSLRLRHGVGLVINPAVVIGDNVTLRQAVTIGNRRVDGDCPIIGNDVEIGAGAVIVGKVIIGDGTKIAPLAYVDFDVPPGSRVLSERATIVKARATDA